MGRAIDVLITYRIIKMLITPFEKQDAYKYGIIDKNGKVLRKTKELKTSKERDSYTILHKFVFNLKRLINVIPGGKSKIGTYAAALGLLLKESKDLNMVEIEKELYTYLRNNDLIHFGDMKESSEDNILPQGRFIMTDTLTDLNNEKTADVGDIVKNVEDQVPFDNFLGVNLYHVVSEETQKKVIVSEDNIERIKF
jgi:hypothetical protein|tara:strand:- start:1353 stop:1940 length:588 start_codon:yes stop_codon:yes gene_type:complete